MPPIRLALVLLPLVCLLMAGPPAQGAVPLGGLAVAVSADGTKLVAGGDSRALYALDPATLAVKRRVHLGRAIVDLAFSPDGSRLWVESTKAVQMLDAGSLKVLKTFENMERMCVAAAAGRIAVQDRREGHIRLYALADGSAQGKVAYERMKSVAGFGLSPDGKQLALIHSRTRTDEEKKVAYKDIPKTLKKAALNEFKQRNDGYRARFLVYDTATGKTMRDHWLWYTPQGGGQRVVWHGGGIHVMGYGNQNARIDAEGKVTYFELANSYNYGLGVSADGSTVLSGGLRDGSRTTLADRKAAAFRVDRLPGFPEYFKSFSLAADGTGFGGTSCWRVVRIDAEGKLVKTAPVH